MIIAVVVFLAAGQPGATLRSRDTFPDAAACAAFVAGESERYREAIEHLTIRLGVPVTHRVGCLLVPQGAAI